MQTRTQLQLGAAATLTAAAFVHARSWQAQRANPPAGRFVDVDGARVHYIERGEGPPLVMLHGLGTMLQDITLSGLFDLAAARYRVIEPDRPGYGYSTRPRRWWGPHSQAALLRSMLLRLGIDRPIGLGHSFGALVATAFALDYPSAARSVVLASGYYFPTLRLDVPLMAPPALPVIGDLMRHTISPLISRLLWPGMLKVLFSPAPVPRYFVERFPTWMALRPSQLRATAEETALVVPSVMRMQRLYPALEVPAIIVAGTQDRYVDHERHSVELSRRIPRSELLLSPRAGHMVHHVDPRRVLQAIEAAAR
jgi:pimeloyl-ACP methyl ester carboxylesterase